jgi:hypothetical protein
MLAKLFFLQLHCGCGFTLAEVKKARAGPWQEPACRRSEFGRNKILLLVYQKIRLQAGSYGRKVILSAGLCFFTDQTRGFINPVV